MLPKICIFVILLGNIFSLDAARLPSALKTKRSSGDSRTQIFEPPEDSDISQLGTKGLPWVLPEYAPAINEFLTNVFEDLQSYPTVKVIFDNFTVDSETSRSLFFKIPNQFLYELGHPAPQALGNIVSEATALFDELTMPELFGGIAVSHAEFFLIENIPIERNTSQSFASSVNNSLQSVDTSDAESVVYGILKGCNNFLKTCNLDLINVIDELFELYANAMINIYGK